jgi:hypothetical protein
MTNSRIDAYQRRYMADGSGVVHHEKLRAPWYLHAATLAAGVFGTVAAVASSAPLWVPVVVATGTLLSWTNFAALRVTVSAAAVHVQFGLFGPRIPVTAIDEVTVGSTSVFRYGGKGIRFGLDGSVAYSQLGDKGKGVEIRWRTKRGRRRTTVVSVGDPERLVEAIRKVCAAAQGETSTSAPMDLNAARAHAGRVQAPSVDAATVLLQGEFGSDEETRQVVARRDEIPDRKAR